MNAAQLITMAPLLALLAMVLAVLGCASLFITIMAKHEERGWRAQAQEARTRAALAESALADIRQRRSEATSRGNHTRAAAQREKRRAMTDQLRVDIDAKRQPPQAEFPFPTSQTGETHG